MAIPLLHARATSRGDLDGMSRCAELLEQLGSEENSIVRLFAEAGVESTDAFTSQALIELRREYCEKEKVYLLPLRPPYAVGRNSEIAIVPPAYVAKLATRKYHYIPQTSGGSLQIFL